MDDTAKQIEFLKGQVEILRNALALVIATHKNKNDIIVALKNIFSYPESKSWSESYKAGSTGIFDELLKAVHQANLHEELNDSDAHKH